MCGRYATTRTAMDLSALFEAVDQTSGSLAVDYNVAPTDPVPVVRLSTSLNERVLSVVRWGLVPSWAPDRKGAARLINARAETVATARAFAKPFAARRCLIPATGWYEFAPTLTRKKQPYFMTPLADEPVVFAGLWSVWGPADDRLLTCSILTTAAIGGLSEVHDRMPLVLPPSRWDQWLTATTDLDSLLVPPTEAEVAALEIRPVGAAVGDVRNDGSALIDRIDPLERPVDLTLF